LGFKVSGFRVWNVDTCHASHISRVVSMFERFDRAAQPEIAELERLSVRGAEEVGGLDVAVHQRGLTIVEEAQGGAELRTPDSARLGQPRQTCRKRVSIKKLSGSAVYYTA